MLDKKELHRWFADKGDETHILNHDLNEDSVVIDIGGYKGVWAEKIVNKYNCTVFIYEPVNEFYNILLKKFATNDRVMVFNTGISSVSGTRFISQNGDASKSNLSGDGQKAKFITISDMDWTEKEPCDLIQINIEGDEYDVLDHMISTGTVNNFKAIQVQFHKSIPDCYERRAKIQEGLKANGFRLKYCYEFVWECWFK